MGRDPGNFENCQENKRYNLSPAAQSHSLEAVLDNEVDKVAFHWHFCPVCLVFLPNLNTDAFGFGIWSCNPKPQSVLKMIINK